MTDGQKKLVKTLCVDFKNQDMADLCDLIKIPAPYIIA